MSRILPNLFLGDVHDAANHKLLESLGVRCILIIAKEIPPFHSRGFTYMKINAHDNAQFDLKKHFREILPFLRLQLEKGGVLVHCYDGSSRSAAVVLAFLMRFRHMSLQKALDFLNAKRPVRPHEEFVRQLHTFEKELKKSHSLVASGPEPEASARKRSRKADKSAPKFTDEGHEEHPGERLAAYMKGREGSKSVTKHYCQMLEVYKKMKGGSKQNIRYRSRSKNARREKKTKSVLGDKAKASLTPEDTPRRAHFGGTLLAKSYVSEQDLGLPDWQARKEGSRKVLEQRKLAMRTLEREDGQQPLFFLEGIGFPLKNKSGVPKTIKDRSAPEVTSVSQRFLSCEKKAEVGGKKSQTNAKAVAKEAPRNVFEDSDSETGSGAERSREEALSKKGPKKSKFNNSISSNPLHKSRGHANGSKSQTNSVKSQLESKVSSLPKNRTPARGKLRAQLAKKKSDLGLKPKRKCSISPPASNSRSKLFEDSRHSQPILEDVANTLGQPKARPKQRYFQRSKKKSRLVHPNLEYLQNKFSSSKQNNRVFPFTPRADKSHEFARPDKSLKMLSPPQKHSSGERGAGAFHTKGDSTGQQKKQFSKSSINRASALRRVQAHAQKAPSNLRSQLIQMNHKRSKHKLITHSPAGGAPAKGASKEHARLQNDSRVLRRKKNGALKAKKGKRRSKRRHHKKHPGFGSPGISKLKKYYSKLKSHSIDLDDPDIFPETTVSPEVQRKPKKVAKPQPADRKRNYQSSKGAGQTCFLGRSHAKHESLLQSRKAPNTNTKARCGEAGQSHPKSRPKKKKMKGLLFKKPLFNLRHKARLSKINLYRDKGLVQPARTHFKVGARAAVWGKTVATGDKEAHAKVFFPNLQNNLEHKFAQRKSESGLANLKQFKFFKWVESKKDFPSVRPSSELNNSLDRPSRGNALGRKAKQLAPPEPLRKENGKERPPESRGFSEGKPGLSGKRKGRLERFFEEPSKEVSKDSGLSLGSEGVSSNGSLNLYSKHKTNRYLVAKKRGAAPVKPGFLQNASSSSKNIGLTQNVSLESSENERTSANLYQRMALEKHAHKNIVCKGCDAFFCRFKNIHEHSKKNEIYRCRYLFVDHLENVSCARDPSAAEPPDPARKKKPRKILCAGCKAVVGSICEKGEKCSCLIKVNGKFKLSKTAIHFKE